MLLLIIIIVSIRRNIAYYDYINLYIFSQLYFRKTDKKPLVGSTRDGTHDSRLRGNEPKKTRHTPRFFAFPHPALSQRERRLLFSLLPTPRDRLPAAPLPLTSQFTLLFPCYSLPSACYSNMIFRSVSDTDSIVTVTTPRGSSTSTRSGHSIRTNPSGSVIHSSKPSRARSSASLIRYASI